MNPRQASPSQLDAWMVWLFRPVHPGDLDPEERYFYTQFLGRLRNLVLIKAVINALIVVLFLFTVLPNAPGAVLLAVVDSLLLLPYYYLARRWPALSTIALLSLSAVALSVADALLGYPPFVTGVLYATLIVAGAMVLLHPRTIALLTFTVTLIFVVTYLVQIVGLVPVPMALSTPRTVAWVLTLHVLAFVGMGVLSSVLARLYHQLLATRSQQDIQRALQEGFRDITANIDLDTLLQRIAERAVSTLPTVDRAFLFVQEGDKLVLRGAAGCGPLHPVGVECPLDLLDNLPPDNPLPMAAVLERLGRYVPPDLRAQWLALPRARAILFYPLQTRGNQSVLLVVSNTRSDEAFDETARRIVDLFACQAAIAIENAQLLANTQERLQAEIALGQVGQEIAGHLRMPELVPAIHRHIAPIMEAPIFLIAVKHPRGGDLELYSPIAQGKARPNRTVPSNGVLGWVIRNRRPLRLGDMQRDIAANPATQDIELRGEGATPSSLLAVPLIHGGQVIGAVSVQSPEPHVYSKADEVLLANLANYIAVAVQNARLYDQVRQKQDELQQLIAMVSQQLQGPAEALLGFSQLLRESAAANLTEEQGEYLERLTRNSYWIAQLVEDMRFLAHLGDVLKEVEPIALSTLARGVATHLELERLGIEVLIQPDMPTLYADPVLLWIYFRNVLRNACRLFQGTTDPQIRVACATSPTGYQLSVQANGQTLTPEQLQRAYELFFPIGEPEDVGIGLAIAQRIGEHYGGSVWAAPAAAGGTTLNLTLPRSLGVNREVGP